MHEGEVFKLIRTSRNISQQEIVKNKLSRTTLSRFENKKIMISISNFNYLLGAVDVSADEFTYIKNNYSYDKKEQIFFLFNNLFSSDNEVSIEKIILLCDEYLKSDYSKSVQCILNVAKVLRLLNESSNEKVNCKSKLYVADIWNELSNIDIWTILDIKIINCCLHFFEPKTYSKIAIQLVSSLEKYKDFTNIIFLEVSIYLNLTLLFLMEKDDEKMKYYAQISIKKAYCSKRIDYIGIALIRYGFIFNEKHKIEEGLSLLKVLEDPNIIESMSHEISSFYSS